MVDTKIVDELTLKDQIILMRKNVRGARQWLIYQLSEKAKHFRTAKKVTNNQQARNLRMSKIHLEEIKIMKRMNVDDVSEYALCHVLESEKNDLKSLAIEERAMLRLDKHKFIQENIQILRNSVKFTPLQLTNWFC